MSAMEVPQLWSTAAVSKGERARFGTVESHYEMQAESGSPTLTSERTERSVDRLLSCFPVVCLFLADLTLAAGAFVLAYVTRFMFPEYAAVPLEIDEYARMGLVVGLTTTLLLGLNGFYDADQNQSWPSRIQGIVSSVSTGLALGAAYVVLVANQPLSGVWFGFSWGFAVVTLSVWRAIADRLEVGARTATASMKRVVIVGANPSGAELANQLASHCRVVGFVDNGTDLLDGSSSFALLGPIAQLDHLVTTHQIDEVIVALPSNRREQISQSIARGFRRPVTVKFLSDLHDLLPQRCQVQHFAGHRFIGFTPAARVSWLKRAADLVLGGLALVAMLPLFGVIAVLIKLDSPGPIFYRQMRVGKHGREFRMVKFRSMHQNADRLLSTLVRQNEATGPLFKMRNDPRVTRVGRVLRRLSLDELPQIFNVVKGEMSLVGPRPPLPSEVAKYEGWQLGRLRAVPGMTGLWQVSGRSEVPFHDMVRLDLHYIRNWSLVLDVEILLRTIPAVLASRGAY